MTVASQWDVELWDCHTHVDSKLSKSIDTLEEICKYIRERASIEAEYSKQMHKLFNKFKPKVKDENQNSVQKYFDEVSQFLREKN